MSEGHETKKDRETLKRELLGNEISRKEFLDAIAQLEEVPGRTNAVANVALLTDPKVQEYFNASPEYKKYCEVTSASFFHIAQRQMIAENNPREALKNFKSAYEWSSKIKDEANEWRWYAEATIAYLDQDLPKLKAAQKKVIELSGDGSPNALIVDRFVKRLESKQKPNYSEDYQTKSK
jgi:hypothetical protein